MTPLSPDVSIFIPDLRGGGAERVAVNLANEFSLRGLRVECVLMQARGEFLGDLRRDVAVVDLRADRVRGTVLPLVRYLKQRCPTNLIAFMWPLTLVAVVARFLARVPTKVIVTEHTTLSASEETTSRTPPWLLFLSIRFLYPQAHAIVAVSKGAAGDLERNASLAAGTVRVIYNPILLGANAPTEGAMVAAARRWADASIRVLAVGTMKTQKRFDRLLDAFALLRARVPAQLMILGEGPLRMELERQVADLGLSHFVSMPGFQPNPRPYFAVSNLFVLSSAWEGFGNVLVEALEHGVSVVSTDCPSGPREILADGAYGQLVTSGHPQALADAMQAAIESPLPQEALRARAAEFTVGHAADAYLRLMGLPLESGGRA